MIRPLIDLTTLLLLTLSLTLWFDASAQPVLSLDSILENVKTRHPTLSKYRLRMDAAHAYAKGAGSWMAPEAGGGLWMVPYKRVPDERDKGQVMISIQQKFTNPAKTRSNKEYMQSNADAEEASLSVAWNELRAMATTAYVQWIIYDKKAVALKQAEAAILKIQKTVQAKIPLAKGNLAQNYKTEARLREVQNMQLANDNDIVRRNILLDQLMNVATSTRFTIDTTTVLVWSGASDSVKLSERRSDLRRIDKNIQSLRLRQAMENAQAKPDFNLNFNHMIARGTGMPNQFMLLGMVTIPIAPWSSSSYRANVKGLGRDIAALQREREETLSAAIGTAAGLKADVKTLQQQIENYEKRILPALTHNYHVVEQAWEENDEDLPSVLEAQEALLMTRLQFLDTVLSLEEANVMLSKELEE